MDKWYDVTVNLTGTEYVEVKATSIEDAEDKACELVIEQIPDALKGWFDEGVDACDAYLQEPDE